MHRVASGVKYRAALAAVFMACFGLCALGGTAMSAEVAGEVSLRLEPRRSVVKEGDEIGIVAVFLTGAREATLILPLGADASGIISFRAIDVASGQEWTATNRDARSFAADAHVRVPAGGRIE